MKWGNYSILITVYFVYGKLVKSQANAKLYWCSNIILYDVISFYMITQDQPHKGEENTREERKSERQALNHEIIKMAELGTGWNAFNTLSDLWLMFISRFCKSAKYKKRWKINMKYNNVLYPYNSDVLYKSI